MGNDFADHLADQGAKGSQTTQSPRWLLPLGAPQVIDPLLLDSCWRCGQVYSGPSYSRKLAGHEGYCKVPGAPPAQIPCRLKCGKMFAWRFPAPGKKHFHHAREFRNLHEKNCRGSDELTRTCPSCNKQFSPSITDDTIWQHRKQCSPQLTTPHAPPPLCGNVTNVNLDAEWISSQLTLHTVEVLSLQTAPVKNAKLFFNPWKSASSMRSGVKGRTWQTERVVFAVRSVEDLVVGWHTNKSAKQPTVSK